MWQVSLVGTSVKQVTVLARARASALGGSGQVPQTTLSAMKTVGF